MRLVELRDKRGKEKEKHKERNDKGQHNKQIRKVYKGPKNKGKEQGKGLNS